MTKTEEFSNRWGIVLASLGMAIGAGNLWRFPRLAGQYGGAFLILWIGFLLIWSIPILLAEFSIGKKYKKGVIGSFGSVSGKGLTWGGFFITVCTLGIAFYYAVVTGWALQYLGLASQNLFSFITGSKTIAVHLAEDPTYLETYWDGISTGSMSTVILYILAVIAGIYLLIKGIQNGLEKANKVLIPSLFGLLIVITVISLNMENGFKGLEYMFAIDTKHFSNPTIWIEALSQSAWSTGAGWGLIMTISSYSRKKEDVVLNTFISGFGNNTASIMAGVAILPAVFALATSEGEAISFLQSGNQALTFTIIPKLFSTITGGAILSFIFFLAFFMAAFSSLLPMLELFISNLKDMGITRKSAAVRAGVFCIIFGFPSAWSLNFFNNQDWVWGIGLIISGLLIIIVVLKYGISKFKKDFIDTDSDLNVPLKYFSITLCFNVVLAVVLIYWWMSRGYSENPWFDANGNWNVFDVYSNASVVTQWALALIAGIAINKYLYNKFVKS
ncbi:sodium-dependent transporter [Fulvivirga lutimaris]|uniref:sodium-dependent transporter n=1 Tax=Fulvivirga lutimaris TaxID=1819566 RepID=UPI0012BBCCE7|nr:sodium-dependent transporter [Fulvivirga lutimaris]MTI41792.1 sodium-dependent transporter [Fulvivirga lutimaris]